MDELTALTPLQEQVIADALDGDYRLRSGMRTANGNVMRFFEVMKGDSVAMVINGDQGTISRIDVLDSDIPTDTGVKISTPFSNFYSKTSDNCQKADGDDNRIAECKAGGSQHISYQFSGEWSGPEGLMPSDDTLENWKASKVIWWRQFAPEQTAAAKKHVR